MYYIYSRPTLMARVEFLDPVTCDDRAMTVPADDVDTTIVSLGTSRYMSLNCTEIKAICQAMITANNGRLIPAIRFFRLFSHGSLLNHKKLMEEWRREIMPDYDPYSELVTGV